MKNLLLSIAACVAASVQAITWVTYDSVTLPSRAFGKVNHYVLRRMARWLNRRSQRRYRLRYAATYYGELRHMGLLRLRWQDYR